MNLKKLIIAEVLVAVAALVAVTVFVAVTPYLTSSGQNSQIGVFNQREYAQKTVTLQSGEKASSRFNYSTYDPAILVVNLKFQDWQEPGYLNMYCNGFLLATINATSRNPNVELTTITFSGFDLVRPPPSKLTMSSQIVLGNEISFLSPKENGYEGTFNYQVSIRGSR